MLEEEGNAEALEAEKRKMEEKVESLSANIENLQLHIQKVKANALFTCLSAI